MARAKDATIATSLSATAQSARASSSDKPVAGVAATMPIGVRLDSSASDAPRAALGHRGGATALVVAALGGQRYLVDIDGEQAAVVLESAGVASGRSLTAGAEVRLIAHPQLEPSLPASQTRITLSATANLVASLALADAAQGATEPGHILASQPLIEPETLSQPQGAATLASRLADAIDQSGLFYESHVAQWSAGERSLDAVRHEPQAAWPTDPKETGRPTTSAQILQSNPEAQSLVREQLQTLATQTVAWSGPVWRNQPAELEIKREPDPPTYEASRTWRARLAIELPTLGRVQVTIALTGHDLRLNVDADDVAATRLARASGTLTQRLESHGVRPHTLVANSTTSSNASSNAAADPT